MFLSIIAGAFFFFLDFNYRTESLMKFLTPLEIVKNATFFLFFLFFCMFLLAAALRLVEVVTIAVIKSIINPLLQKLRKQPAVIPLRYQAGTVSSFLFYLVFIYINLVYNKLYLVSYVVKSMSQAIVVVTVLLVVAVVLYIVVFRKKISYEAQREVANPVVNAGRVVFFLVFVLAVIFYLTDFEYKHPQDWKRKVKPSIIMVTCDSLGARHMSLYGYPRPTTPHLEQLAAESYTFDHMIANSNETTYCMSSFLGKYPRFQTETNYPPGKSMAAALKDAGYNKRLFVSFTHYNRFFSQDFTEYVVLRRFDAHPITWYLYMGENRRNFQWLSDLLSSDERFINLWSDRNPRDFNESSKSVYPVDLYLDFATRTVLYSDEPVFIWVHLFEPHHPYHVPPAIKNCFGTSLPDKYDASVLYIDAVFGKFLKHFKRYGNYDSDILIVSADHGESFGEEHAGWRGMLHGSHWMNESVNHIPLIIHMPGQKEGKRVQTFAEQVDLAPTILDLLHMPIPGYLEGESLVPYMQDENKLSEKVKIAVPASHFVRDYMDLSIKPGSWAVATEDMFNAYIDRYKIGWFHFFEKNDKNPKLINTLYDFRIYGIYDLFSDPQEKKNLFREQERFEPMVKKLVETEYVKYYYKRKP